MVQVLYARTHIKNLKCLNLHGNKHRHILTYVIRIIALPVPLQQVLLSVAPLPPYQGKKFAFYNGYIFACSKYYVYRHS